MLHHPARVEIDDTEQQYGATCARLQGARLLKAAAVARGSNDKVSVQHILEAPRISTFGPRIYGLMLVERGQAKWDQNDVDGAQCEFSLISKVLMHRHEDVAARVYLHQANVRRRESYLARAKGDIIAAVERCDQAIRLAAYAARCAEVAGDARLQGDCNHTVFYSRGLKAAIAGAGPVRFDRLITGVMLAIKGRDAATPPVDPPGIFGPTCLAHMALQSSCPTPAILGDMMWHEPSHRSAFRKVFGSPTPGTYAGWLLERTREHMEHPGHRPLSVARALVFVAKHLGASDLERSARTQFTLLELALAHQRYRDSVHEAMGYQVPLLPGVNEAMAHLSKITGLPSDRRLLR